jgi:hypothetical protein
MPTDMKLTAAFHYGMKAPKKNLLLHETNTHIPMQTQ